MPPTGGIVEYNKPGDHITVTANATILGGQLVELSANRTVIVGTANVPTKVVGVALHDATAGQALTVATEGVWPLKAAGAIAAGDQVVPAATGQVATLAAAAAAAAVDINNARSLFGQALEAISNGATGRVRLTS